jgi:SAM-dependent methyltransferase
MDGGDPDRWSAMAADWAELWGEFPAPAWRAVVTAAGIGPGSRALDVGCGSGEFLSYLRQLGASPAGIDPAPGMVELARARVPDADVRLGAIEELPWPDGSFDAVTAFNALQFAGDTLDALAECVRVARPGGHVAVANWAEGDRNDLNAIEAAVAKAAGETLLPDGDLRQPGGLEALLADAGLEVVATGLVELVWEVPDDDTLVRGVLMGEDPPRMAATAPTVLTAARKFRTPTGGYRLLNAFRYAVCRTPLVDKDAGP